jgi:hypothetical protein
VWQSIGSAATDSDGTSIQGQRYNSLGTAQGGQFQVNSYTSGDQIYPNVSTDVDGDFVIAWHSAGSSGTDSTGYSLQLQRYGSSGSNLGSQIQVNTYTTGDQLRAALASDASGNFTVVWDSDGSFGSDNLGTSIQALRFDDQGMPLLLPSFIYLPISRHNFQPCFAGLNEAEPNNDDSEANGPLCGPVTLSGLPNDARDYFTFELENAGLITIDLADHPLESEDGAQLQLFFQNLSNLVGIDLAPPYEISHNGAAGQYFVLVFTDLDKCAGNCDTAYDLTISFP